VAAVADLRTTLGAWNQVVASVSRRPDDDRRMTDAGRRPLLALAANRGVPMERIQTTR